MKQKFIITIDGPARTGKTTAAKTIAEQKPCGMPFRYLSTGDFYRAAAVAVIDKNPGLAFRLEQKYKGASDTTKFSDDDGIAVWSELSGHNYGYRIRAEFDDSGAQRMLLLHRAQEDKETILSGTSLRADAISSLSSIISAFPAVRSFINKEIRDTTQSVPYMVLDGRDTGTAMFPDADLKFYLYARPRERARRYLAAQGTHPMLASEDRMSEIMIDITARDRRDASREADPLRVAADAIWLDVSDINAEHVSTLLTGIAASRLDPESVPVF